MKKKKLRSSIIVTSFALVVLPASVYASLQPINLGATGEQTPSNLETIAEESLPVIGQKKGSSLTSREVLLQVPPIVSVSQEIFRSINTGNIEGAINRILGILGQLGLLNPASESERIRTNPENPYSNPQTPEEVYQWQRHSDIIRSEIGQKLSQVVFGVKGQQALLQQTQAVQQAWQISQTGQRGVAATYQQSAGQAQQNVSYAKRVEAQAKKAQSAKVSQRILQALAAQNEDLAKIGSGNSAQLAYLGKAASYQSAQLSVTNSQLTALNDKTQTLEVLSASQNYQAAQINAAIERQSYYQQTKDSLQQNAAYQSSSSIYIPGLVPKGDGT